jgi:hypothetical protein
VDQIHQLTISFSSRWRSHRCVQSAGCQPPATDLWLNRFEPDGHRIVVDRTPPSMLSRWHSRWVLKRRVPPSTRRCACLVLLRGRYIHLPRASHSLSAGLSFTSMGFHAKGTHELACPQLVERGFNRGKGAKPARSDLCLALWSRRCA